VDGAGGGLGHRVAGHRRPGPDAAGDAAGTGEAAGVGEAGIAADLAAGRMADK